MSIEFVVDFPCAVKKALSQPRLIQLVKSRNQAETVLRITRERGDERPPDQIHFECVVYRVDRFEGDLQRETASVQAVLDEARVLDAHAHHCPECPANAAHEPFGCYGSIPYPIGEEMEAWLLSLFPPDLDTPVGMLLRSAVRDFRYDGGPFLRMRLDGTFFRRRKPLQRSWETKYGSWRLTSDQALQMLFGVGHLQASQCLMLAWFAGIVPHQLDLGAAGGLPGLQRQLGEHDVAFASEDAQIQACIPFFRAVRAAALLDVQVLIDM
jgi:hypothetical protein